MAMSARERGRPRSCNQTRTLPTRPGSISTCRGANSRLRPASRCSEDGLGRLRVLRAHRPSRPVTRGEVAAVSGSPEVCFRRRLRRHTAVRLIIKTGVKHCWLLMNHTSIGKYALGIIICHLNLRFCYCVTNFQNVVLSESFKKFKSYLQLTRHFCLFVFTSGVNTSKAGKYLLTLTFE